MDKLFFLMDKIVKTWLFSTLLFSFLFFFHISLAYMVSHLKRPEIKVYAFGFWTQKVWLHSFGEHAKWCCHSNTLLHQFISSHCPTQSKVAINY